MRLAICQINPIIGDFQGNTQKIIHQLSLAKAQGAQLVALPECVIPGYPPEDLLAHDSFITSCEEALQQLLPYTEGLTVVLGVPRRNPDFQGKPLYNSAAILKNGKVLGYQDKSLLPTYNVFDEARYFAEGDGQIKIWKVGSFRFGVAICEDIWAEVSPHQKEQEYHKKPIASLKDQELDLLIHISASPFTKEKPSLRLKRCQELAKQLDSPVCMVNQVGANDCLIFDGGSLFVDRNGYHRVQAASFQESLRVFDSDGVLQDQVQTQAPLQEKLYQALVLGARDFFSKQGFKKAYIGLSGGIDSALTAVLATDALGADNVTTIAMPSRYTSKASIQDAKALAENLGLACHDLSIERLYQQALDDLAPAFAGLEADSTEENIQARLRGLLLMAYANKHQGIVLATGNKSELATGYCTLYGDMCGGLSLIGDLWKTEVYELCQWINSEKLRIPESILLKAPSAELRANQTDQDTLPPYEKLDPVLRAYIEEKLDVDAIVFRTGESLEFVQSIIALVHRNEFKRRQAAPALIVSKQAFSYGYRYPIVQKWI